MTRKKHRLSATRRWHRSVGASSAVFVIFMVFSGLAINHANSLGLDRSHVSQSFLLDWYGLGEPESIKSFAIEENWLSFAGSQVYLDGEQVSTLSGGVGAVFNGGMLIAAGSDELLLLDREGGLIERLPWEQPGSISIESIGLLGDGSVSVKTGDRLWLADAQLLQWQSVNKATVTPTWSAPASAPGAIHLAITQQYRGAGLSLERLLLDLHSGRFFGSAGVLVYDLLALAIGFLAISGLILWARGRRNGKNRLSKR